MSSWTVVNFVKENTVEAVPSSWVKENHCYWPPYLGDSLQAALKKCHSPKDNWNLHPIETYKNGIFDDYLLARNKANKALTKSQACSDLESDYTASTAGRPKRNKSRVISSDDSTESEEEISVLASPPRLCVQKNKGSTKNCTKRKKLNEERDEQTKNATSMNLDLQNKILTSSCSEVANLSSPCIETVEINNVSDSETLSVNVIKGHAPLARENTPSRNYQGVSSPYTRTAEINHTPESEISSVNVIKRRTPFARENTPTEDLSRCRCCPEHPRKDGFFTQIIKKQNIIHATLLQLIEDVSSLKNQNPHQIPDVDKSIFMSVALPANDKHTLDALENYLGSPAQMNDAIIEVSKIGGCSASEFIKRSMPRFLTDEVAQEFNWLGKKQKRTFSITNLSSLLLGALKKNNATSDATDKDGEIAIKKYLKGAKERADKARK